MKRKDLLKQLNSLNKQVQPDLEWQRTNREILVAQIKAQSSTAVVADKVLWHNLLAKRFIAVTYKPVAAVILIFGIIMGGYITTVGATKNSLPGDFLYPVKLTAERMQVNFASSDEKKVNLEITFAERRLDEIKKVTAQDDNDSDKQENLKVSLQKYQENISNIKTGLAKLEKTNSAAALKVANLLDEKTKDYVGILKDQENKNPEITPTVTTKEAITASQSTGERALDLIVKEYQAGNEEVTFDMVYQKVEAKYNQLNNYVQSAQDRIAVIITNKKIAEEQAKAAAEAAAREKAAAEAAAIIKAGEEAEAAANEENTDTSEEVEAEPAQPAEDQEEVPAENTEAEEQPVESVTPEVVSVPEVILPSIEEIKDKPAEMQKLLAEARGYLMTKEVVLAYSRIKQTDEIMSLVMKVIEANSQYLQTPADAPAPADVEGKEEDAG